MTEPLDLVAERHSWLVERLFTTRRIVTIDAASELGVSVDTVRRDLRTLHDRGLVRRVHGGALPVSTLPLSFSDRSAETDSTPPVLAQAIVERFRESQVVGLDAGSTNVEIASLIPSTLAITIVTNNPAAAVVLADHRAATVILLGGLVDLTWMAAVGSETVDAWRNYRLDLGIVGLCGFDPIAGATTNSQAEVATKRALMESAAETIVPIRAEKLRTAAPYVVAEAGQIDTMVVEVPCDVELDQLGLDQFRESSIDVVVVE